MTKRQRKDIVQSIKVLLPFTTDIALTVNPEQLLYIRAAEVIKILAWLKILEESK
jgi:hypothetical protein